MFSLLNAPLAIADIDLSTLSTLTVSSFIPPLPLLGLITSTSALVVSYCEATFLGPLANPNVSPAVIRTVWRKSFLPGFLIVVSSRIGSVVSGVAGYRASPPDSPAAVLYAAGIAFTIAHFAFLPWASAALDPILNEKYVSADADAKVHEGNKQFIRIDTVRTFVSEVPAFLCFLGASLAYLQA